MVNSGFVDYGRFVFSCNQKNKTYFIKSKEEEGGGGKDLHVVKRINSRDEEKDILDREY